MKSLETRQQEVFTSSNYLRVFPGGSALKNLPAVQEGLIPWSGRSSGEGNGTHFTILTLEIPRTEEPGGIQCMGSQGLDMTYNNVNTEDDRNLLMNSYCLLLGIWEILEGDIFKQVSFPFTVQFSSVAWSCPTLCIMPGFPVHHQLPEPTQIHVHCISDAIQPSHPLSSPSPPAFNLS